MTAASNIEGIVSYYQTMTWAYNGYSQGAYGWHFGVWDKTAQTVPEALINSNRRLVRGAKLGPGSRMLDVGCGVGGFATWAARELGCSVTGVTVVPGHIDAAQELARRRGVSELCTFQLMDMADLRFEPESFDLVANQETFCYVDNKKAYFERVHSILKPGGLWRSIDFALREGTLTPDEEALHTNVCGLWYLAPLATGTQVDAALASAGFQDRIVQDVTEFALPDAKRIIRFCRVAGVLTAAKLHKVVFPRKKLREEFLRHISAGRAYSEGLLHGPFRNISYSALKA
jgi:SAM-dependent methyltransferase